VDSVLHYTVAFLLFSLAPFLLFFVSTRLSILTLVLLLLIFLFIVHLDLQFVHLVVLFLVLFIALSFFASSFISVNNSEWVTNLTLIK
jgi:hypothetical protein